MPITAPETARMRIERMLFIGMATPTRSAKMLSPRAMQQPRAAYWRGSSRTSERMNVMSSPVARPTKAKSGTPTRTPKAPAVRVAPTTPLRVALLNCMKCSFCGIFACYATRFIHHVTFKYLEAAGFWGQTRTRSKNFRSGGMTVFGITQNSFSLVFTSMNAD